MKMFNISFPRVEIESTTCHVYTIDLMYVYKSCMYIKAEYIYYFLYDFIHIYNDV